MRIRDAEKEYRRFRRQQGMKPSTINNDKVAFNVMTHVLGEDATLEELDGDSMMRILEYCSTTRQNSSINNIQGGMSGFFKWARTFKHVTPDFDPLAGFSYRRVPKAEIPRISIDQFPLLLDSSETPRDRILIALGLYLFLRTSEIESLQIKHINLAEGTVQATIHKTGDFDSMPISAELDRELRRWFSTYSEAVGELNSDYYVVPNRNKGRNAISRGEYSPLRPIRHTERYIRKAVIAMGWTEDDARLGIHLLRRSGARAWFDELNEHTIDGALKIVQAHLHHASVVMTERYLGLTADRTKRDRLLKGQSMFPSLTAGNVHNIRKAG